MPSEEEGLELGFELPGHVRLAIRPGPAVSFVVMCVMWVQAEVVLPRGFSNIMVMMMMIINFILQ